MLFGFFLYEGTKRNYVVTDYFNQGRWEFLRAKFNKMNKSKNSSVLFGDSMTENIYHYLPNDGSFVDMGISGDFSIGLLKRFENIKNYHPDNVFIMIGINDLIEKIPVEVIFSNYRKLIRRIQKELPDTKIYVQSTLPTTGRESIFGSSQNINNRVEKLNGCLKKYCWEKGINYIDMYNDFTDENNELKKMYTTDGIHLNKEGYAIWIAYLQRITY